MKKFLACLLIIAVFGGFLFFTGWTQRKISSDEVGIVVSKIHGIDPEIVQKGKFTFHKAFWIPGNAEIKKFKLQPCFSESTVSGSLPSADFYKGDSIYSFDYSFSFSTEIHVNPEDVFNLYSKNKITGSDDLEKYLQLVSREICQCTASFYLTELSRNPGFIPESMTIIDLYKACKFNEKFPDVEIDALALKTSKIPDYTLYNLAREKTYKMEQ